MAYQLVGGQMNNEDKGAIAEILMRNDVAHAEIIMKNGESILIGPCSLEQPQS